MWWLIQKIWNGIKIVFECIFSILGSIVEGLGDCAGSIGDSFDSFDGFD